MKVVDLPLDDGAYDAFILSAETREDDELALELTITTGPHKGEVVAVRATGMDRDAIALVGLPCTLHVDQGQPRVEW